MKFSDSYLGKLRQKVGHRLLQVPGSRIIIENRHGLILLQKRSDCKLWGLPAGSPELKEKIVDCIKREVREETGLTIRSLKSIGFACDPGYEIFKYPNGDIIHNYSMIFYSNDYSGKLNAKTPETLDLRWCSAVKLPEMIIINHKRTINYFLRYMKTGKFQIL